MTLESGVETDQLLILLILVLTVALFCWGRWRHDMVAMGALLACVLVGITPTAEAFAGFGHPAVITVACVLVLSAGLQRSGAVNGLTRYLIPQRAGVALSMAGVVGLGALLSGFMNNVGAMALLMPVALHMARRLQLPPGRVLMPLAFGTILGGMTTLIGTPPNIIVAGFRSQTDQAPFSMFDFTPVGLAVALAGLAFIVLLGWRLVPSRQQAGADGFDTGAYITEARVPEDGKLVGKTLGEIEDDFEDLQVLGLVRHEFRLMAPNAQRRIQAGDILVLELGAESLSEALSALGLTLEESKQNTEAKDRERDTPTPSTALAAGPHQTKTDADASEDDSEADATDDIVLTELAVLPRSPLVGRSATDIQLRTRYGINMLAVSREGNRAVSRLRTLKLQAGDLLLLQGTAPDSLGFASDFGCVPLAERALTIPDRKLAIKATLILVVSIVLAALGILPAAVAFALGVLASMVLQTVPWRSLYEAVDWPVVVLLAALMPVATAMETTGTADWLARGLMENVVQGNAILALATVLVVTMMLSDVMNNAATAAVMAPVAISTANQLNAQPDPFLMAVAIGASCAFLTPIGHQNNTLILGPGGFRFGDYWQLGLPLEILVTLVSIPMLLWIWPL